MPLYGRESVDDRQDILSEPVLDGFTEGYSNQVPGGGQDPKWNISFFIKAQTSRVAKQLRTEAYPIQRDLMHITCNLCGSKNLEKLFRLKAFAVFRCPDCGLIAGSYYQAFKDPKSIYDDAYFESRSEYFFSNPVFTVDCNKEGAHIANFKKGLSLINRLKQPGRLLDVGCAVGVFLTLAREKGWETYGIDVSEYAVSHCTQLLGHTCFCGQLGDARYPDQYFDVITLWDVLEHFQDPSSQLSEINRILKTDGIILLDTPNAESLLRFLAMAIYKLSLGKITYPLVKLYHEFHLYYFSHRTLEKMLRKSGFEIIHFERRCIPILKARGKPLERSIVKLLSYPERFFRREFELFAIAQKLKRPATEAAGGTETGTGVYGLNDRHHHMELN